MREALSLEAGKIYKVKHLKSKRWYEGKLKNIARMRTGAVLGFLILKNGQVKGLPITKYCKWYEGA